MDRRVLTAAVLFALTIAMYFATRPHPPKSRTSGAEALRSNPLTAAATPVASNAELSETAVQAQPTQATASVAPPESPATGTAVANAATPTNPDAFKPEKPGDDVDPVQDLEGVQLAIRNFRDVIGENPCGTNAEITQALLGNNLKQVKMTMPTGSQLNENGELVDRWGTPYFFHQISGTEMEIRSAGPDRKMWTRDDRQVK
jgi:hypothetical protein